MNTIRKRGKPLGTRASKETRKRMSDAKIGTTLPQETKDKIGASMKKVWKDLKDRAGEII